MRLSRDYLRREVRDAPHCVLTYLALHEDGREPEVDDFHLPVFLLIIFFFD